MKRYLVLLLLIGLLIPASVIAADVGKISGMKGAVQTRAKRVSPYENMKNGATVSEGCWIKTGADGWAELTLADRTRFTLANDTEFEITSFRLDQSRREGVFNLSHGKLRANVAKFSGRLSGVTVKSGTAVAGIKGTEFLMLSEGPSNIFFGAEGEVAVSGDGSGVQRALTANTMVQNTQGEEPLEALVVDGASPLGEARDMFSSITAAEPPDSWSYSGRIGDIIARWNVNHGRYLADAGKYSDSLQVFQIALDLSKIPELQADARLERGAVFARFLNKPEPALAEYQTVLSTYPELPQAEVALFSSAQALSELGRKELARSRFLQYLNDYPSGKYRSTAETLLRFLD
jgi:tetratricopeptide (TPR) repeat protein